jgi:antitoxin ParD1/3/4
MPRSFALGEHFERLIDEQVRSGRYGNASEVVRAGLRLLEEREARVARLREAIAEGRRSGAAGPIGETLDRLEARYRAMAEAKAER